MSEKEIMAEMLECLEGILAFTDGFGFYRTQSPAGIALEQWIEAARDAVADAKRAMAASA